MNAAQKARCKKKKLVMYSTEDERTAAYPQSQENVMKVIPSAEN